MAKSCLITRSNSNPGAAVPANQQKKRKKTSQGQVPQAAVAAAQHADAVREFDGDPDDDQPREDDDQEQEEDQQSLDGVDAQQNDGEMVPEVAGP